VSKKFALGAIPNTDDPDEPRLELTKIEVTDEPKEVMAKLIIVGDQSCKPCLDLKEMLAPLSEGEVEYIDIENMTDEQESKLEEVTNEHGWSGGIPAVYVERNGVVLGELWTGTQQQPAGTTQEQDPAE